VIAALKRATATIPIVFAVVADPVGDGFVASLSRPGGNITGFSSFDPEIGGKWVQLLKEVAPAITRVALLFNPRTAPAGIVLLAFGIVLLLFRRGFGFDIADSFHWF
jgi:ABC-type uncharacterized transport system substrate-binding protein